jgi:hypothetical protein
LKSLRCLLVILVGFVIGGDLAAKAPASKDKHKKAAPAGAFPSFDRVTRTVETHLTANRNYRAGDLLTTATVEPLFRKLEKINWKVADRRDILKLMLSDSDWLARQFATQSGRDFMRQIAALPSGYDRVDRYRRMPWGQEQLVELINAADGYKMIEYMTTTRGGKNLGGMLSQGVNGENFNRPTGRIYTELDFLKRLKKSYDAEAVRRLSIEESQPTEDLRTRPQNEPPGSSAPDKSGNKAAKPPQQPEYDDPFEKPTRG